MDESLSKGDAARAAILNTARRLFIANGFHGTSMRAIAHEAGDRAVGGIYNHFPTKEAIFRALIEEDNPYEVVLGTLETELDRASTGPEFVGLALKTVLAVIPNYYDFLQLAQIDLREFEGQTVRHLLRSEFFPRIMGVIQRMQTLPGLKPLEPYTILRMMASLVIGFVITERLIPGDVLIEFSRDVLADQFIDTLLHGLADEPIPHLTTKDTTDDQSESPYAVDVHDVYKRFGSVHALQGLSLQIRRGEIYGLLGPNGAGKSTLIRVIAGLHKPDSGRVTLLDHLMPDKDILARVGYMTQASALYTDLTVWQNVAFFAGLNGCHDKAAIEEAIAFVDLSARTHSRINTLSGGMRQRVSLASVLAHHPDVILLDEPTVGVDPQLRFQFWDHFRAMTGARDHADRVEPRDGRGRALRPAGLYPQRAVDRRGHSGIPARAGRHARHRAGILALRGTKRGEQPCSIIAAGF